MSAQESVHQPDQPQASTPIDHEAIRAIGASMSLHIDSIVHNQDGREKTIDTLNEHSGQVPYTELFEESDRLITELSDLEIEAAIIDDEQAQEVARLDSMVATFKQKGPRLLDAAKAQADKKKQLAKDEAATKREDLQGPKERKEAEFKEISTTVDSVSMAWPVAPYSEEVIEKAARLRAEAEADLSEAEEVEATNDSPVLQAIKERAAARDRAAAIEASKPKVVGPYAELAASIPDLSERLHDSVSEHAHVYGDIETAKAVYDRALAKDQAERTQEEDFVVKAVYVLQTKFLAKPRNLDFLEVYETSDVISLLQQLRKFSKKNRPDFDDIEGQILEKAATPIAYQRDVPADLQGAIERMNNDEPGRVGLTWHKLSKYAERACDTMRARLFAGGSQNKHLKNYAIDVVDRSSTKPDLSWVYQFVADSFAFDVLGQRRTVQQGSTEERFEQNCEIISNWFEEARPLLEQLPKDFRLRRFKKAVSRFSLSQGDKPAFENASALASIKNTIADIEIRRAGTGDGKAARHKPAKFDPQGALNHQLRLAHHVVSLKEDLVTYAAPTPGRIEDIELFE